jgi:hypothetical protein
VSDNQGGRAPEGDDQELREALLAEAAKRLCRVRGQDPDRMVQYDPGDGKLLARFRPCWKSAREELVQTLWEVELLREFGLL